MSSPPRSLARELLDQDPEWAAILAKRCKKAARRVIPIVRSVAEKHGYAIGVHGSLARDIDLIAAPWTETAVPPHDLVEAVRIAVEGYCTDRDRQEKPHGRVGWSIHLGGGPYIDISVMPPMRPDPADA